jgi:Cof subfamily protein (haloacid dehalogenase superfamily)
MAQIKQEIAQTFPHENVYLTQSSQIYLEMTNPDVNKGNAIRYLTEKILGLQPENVMAIGDNFNDLEMLKYAGFSVAMGDAPTEIKNIAQWVAPTVEEDGVAIALEQLIVN